MRAKHFADHRHRKELKGFKNLLVWLLVYLLISPFLEQFSFANLLVTTFLTLVLASAVYAVSQHRRLFYAGMSLLAVIVVLIWLTALNVVTLPIAVTSGLLIIYLGILVYSFARKLMRVRKVTSNAVCAALCLYLIMGLLWGGIYALVEDLQPGSFAGKLVNDAENASEKSYFLNYFSFVTLSTLGYGDIAPQTPEAAALCQMEAILGQFFSLVVVARLVGIQVSQEVGSDTKKEVSIQEERRDT